MIITEALARSDSPHAVFFMLTAYLEQAHRHPGASSLPEALLELPLRGMADVQARRAEAAALFTRCIGETGSAAPLVSEIDVVFDAALCRLGVLGAQSDDQPATGPSHTTAPSAPCRQSDARR